MRIKIIKLLILFIIIITLTLLTCTFLDKEMKLVLPTDLYDGDTTQSRGEGVVQIYDHEESELIIELRLIPDDEDDVSKILIVPPFVTIPKNELSIKFNCKAIDTDMSPETAKKVTVRASATHYKDVEDTVTINDVDAEPTPEPTVQPTSAPSKDSPGAVWLEPEDLTVTIGEEFTTEVHCNTEDQKLGTYGIDFHYTALRINVNTTVGLNGVEAIEPDGFVVAVNSDTPGELITTGFDTTGTGPGDDLHILTIHWKVVATERGETEIEIVVNKLTDESPAVIGTPQGINYSITIDD